MNESQAGHGLPAIVLALLLSAASVSTLGGEGPQAGTPMPEFTETRPSAWLNSAPLRLQQLRGEVLLITFWTFDCANCQRSLPWLNELETSLANSGLRLLSIHTPEFAHETRAELVAARLKLYRVTHPVMLDNSYAYWEAAGNRYWPSFYVVDRQGRLRGRFAGETHRGDEQAQAIENLLRQLLSTNAADP